MIARFWLAVDSAIEAVIGAVVDRICREWAEETAQAAKEEGVRGREADVVAAAAQSLAINHRHFADAADILRHYAEEHRAGADRLARYSSFGGVA